MSDLFSDMANVKGHERDSYFALGRYRCELLAVKRITSTKPKTKGQTKIIAEFRVLDVADKHAGDVAYPQPSNPVGDRCAVVLDVEGPYGERALVELRAILTAVMVSRGVRIPGTDRAVAVPSDLSEEHWRAMGPRMISGFTYVDKSGAEHVTATPSPHVAGAIVEVTAVRRTAPAESGRWYASMRYLGVPSAT